MDILRLVFVSLEPPDAAALLQLSRRLYLTDRLDRLWSMPARQLLRWQRLACDGMCGR